jgi:hypothetical protein
MIDLYGNASGDNDASEEGKARGKRGKRRPGKQMQEHANINIF